MTVADWKDANLVLGQSFMVNGVSIAYLAQDATSITVQVSNNSNLPTITLNKNVINDDGGTAGAGDFGLTINGTSVASGQTITVAAGVPFPIDETGLSGYSFTGISGDTECPGILGGNVVSLALDDDVTCTITNNDFPKISIDDVIKAEGISGTTNFGFTVTRSNTVGALSIDYITVNNSANSSSDYVFTSGTLNFVDSGASSLPITVPVNGDVTIELNETFFVNLSNCIGCTIIDSQGLGTITDDDASVSPNDLDSDGIPDTIDMENIISSSTTITNSHIIIGNIIVQNGALLTISPGNTLFVPSDSNILILHGGGVLIESGGTLKTFS